MGLKVRFQIRPPPRAPLSFVFWHRMEGRGGYKQTSKVEQKSGQWGSLIDRIWGNFSWPLLLFRVPPTDPQCETFLGMRGDSAQKFLDTPE